MTQENITVLTAVTDGYEFQLALEKADGFVHGDLNRKKIWI